MIKKILVIVALTLLWIPVIASVQCDMEISDVEAAGITSVNLTISEDDHDGYFSTYDLGHWDDAVDGMPGQRFYNLTGIGVGWSEYLEASDDWSIKVGAVGFDAVEISGTIESASVYLYIYEVLITEDWNLFLALYEGAPSVNHTLQNSDLPSAYNLGSNKLSTYEYITDELEGYYIKFDIDSHDFEYLEGDEWGKIWFWIMSTNHAIGIEPPRIGTGTWSHASVSFEDIMDTHKPILTINSIEAGTEPTVSHSTNAAIATENTTGVVDSITWESPRAAYSNETIAFDIAGDAGTPIQLQLVTEYENYIDTRNDWIRSDGHYYWQSEISPNTQAFIRAVEINGGMVSDWGHTFAQRETKDWNTTNCVDTQEGHERSTMEKFRTDVGRYMYVHWKTNVDGATELNDYNVELWRLGLDDDVVYSANLGTLADDYYKHTDADNDSMLNIRYAIFTMYEKEGFNDYDGMALPVGLEPNYGNYGFYTPEITDNSSVSITEPLDAYWYLAREQDGVVLAASSDGVMSRLTANVGLPCKVQTDLNRFQMYWVDDAGDSIGSNPVIGNAYDTMNTFEIDEPQVIGSYYLHVEFSSPNTDFIYKRNIPITVDEGVKPGLPGFTESIGEKIKRWIVAIGMDNPVGHWIIMLGLMCLMFIIFHKSEVLRVLMPLLILGLGMVIEWVDVWIVALLALGAGFTIFRALRKQISGGAE